MKRSILLGIAVAAVTLAAFGPSNKISEAKSDKFRRSPHPIEGRYIVVLDNSVPESESSQESLVDQHARTYRGKVGKVFSNALKGYAVEMTEQDAKTLAENPDVKYVEEDSYVWPNDTITDTGWGLDRIDQRNLPYDNQYSFSEDGSGVNVYILDSGVMVGHEALAGRAFEAFDAVHDNTPIEQCNGHGTGVAGVVGSTNFGVAERVRLHSVRVLPCSGAGTLSDVIAGVDWVTRRAVRPAVANMSLGSGFSKAFNDAVSASIRSGITYVVAAGNETGDACRYSPSSVPEAITVGASNSVDGRVYYSNFGACVDLFAPGQGVRTIWNTTPDTYTFASGTSFASPFVAGVAALYLQRNPSASPQEVSAAIAANATSGVLTDVGDGSPNLLLYSLFEGGNPPSPPSSCAGNAYEGSISSGATHYQSSTSGFAGGNGNYSGSLSVPAGAVVSLALEKKSRSRWAAVATSSSGEVNYRGKSGSYRWRIQSASGSGDYSLCSITP